MEDLPAQLKWFGKRVSNGTFILVFLIYCLIVHGPSWVEVVKKEKPPPPVLGQNDEEQKVEEEENKGCIILAPIDEYEFEREFDKIEKQGNFYYPTGKGKTWEGAIWIKNKLKPNFKKIFIEYEISSREDSEKPPAFILTIARPGEKNERQIIAKLWSPEFSEKDGVKIPQLIGFARSLEYEEDSKPSRDESIELRSAVRMNQSDSLTVKPTNINGNEMTINFTYNYTSDDDGMAIPSSFTKKLIFPFSNLASSGEFMDLGLGTFVDYGLRIVSLKICYP